MNTVRSINTPTLARADHAFTHWRKHREQRRQTPPELRQQAVELLEHYRPFHICQTLGLNADALKRWAREFAQGAMTDSSSAAPDFVALALPLEQPSAHSEMMTLVIERPDGSRLNVSGRFSLAELMSSLELGGVSR